MIKDVMGVKSESDHKRAAMLALKVLGGASWIGAYELAIRETRETGNIFLPSQALSFNLAWEAIYTAGGIYKWGELTLEDRVQTVVNGAWLFQDLRWVSACKHAGVRFAVPTAVAATGYQLGFLAGRQPGDAARISALMQNLAFSLACAVRPAEFGESAEARKFTALRAFGTAVPTFTSGLLRGYRAKYFVPGLACIAFDSVRLFRQNQGLPA